MSVNGDDHHHDLLSMMDKRYRIVGKRYRITGKRSSENELDSSDEHFMNKRYRIGGGLKNTKRYRLSHLG